MTILKWMYTLYNYSLIKSGKFKFSNDTASHFEAFCDDRTRLFIACESCGHIIDRLDLIHNLGICEACGYHFKLTAHERVNSLVDKGTWTPLNELLSPVDSLNFDDDVSYGNRLRQKQTLTNVQDAVVTGVAFINKVPAAIAVMDFNFLGGSMGSVVGEQITRLIEYATKQNLYLIIFCASGGARMQEGSLSLMQMSKVSGALHTYQKLSNLFYISVCTSPTTGGVSASFAMLGDIILAEPGAVIAFAGRRVIENTIGEELPKGFQTSEYLYKYGQLDAIVNRFQFKGVISDLYSFFRETRYHKIEFLNQYSRSILLTENKGLQTIYERYRTLAINVVGYFLFNYTNFINILDICIN